MWKQLTWQLKRIWFDISALIFILCIIYFTPDSYISVVEGAKISPKIGLIALFFSKFLFVSAGILHAHITREVLFPYINFKEEGLTSNALLVIILYAVIIWSWAHGG